MCVRVYAQETSQHTQTTFVLVRIYVRVVDSVCISMYVRACVCSRNQRIHTNNIRVGTHLCAHQRMCVYVRVCVCVCCERACVYVCVFVLPMCLWEYGLVLLHLHVFD